MMTKPQANTDLKDKLELDLAQLYLREGDLQRMNGRNEAAIQDYQSCLRLRKASKFLDKYDRKIADVHYNLGLVYINLASKDDETLEDDESKPAKTDDDEKAKEAKRVLARNKSVYHFLECSKCFCGQIASICNANPESITKIEAGDLDNVAKEDDSTPKFKTTGEEDDETELPNVASSKLSIMRKRVEALINSADMTTEQREKVNDLSQLLEDIQETVDEAENSTKGVQEVTNMKAEVAALAAADGDIEPQKEGTSTTTIGFGGASSATVASAASATSVAPSAASSGTATAARPMMVVKKKKRAALQIVEEPDSKKPKAENE
jgi:tetratricopeptide (TPR) repeat protein